MKKLLGILGTITIAGSGMAGLVGNAPATAKNEINHLQTNNLLRNKRTPNSEKTTTLNTISHTQSTSLGGKLGGEVNIFVIKTTGEIEAKHSITDSNENVNKVETEKIDKPTI
ncbi:hypothetical protein [Spiroplasma endosymbiont of Eupeodes luniger]|uniref:hypothetical protein n=1 Tax=Spiroplasma endosymbiont of Eupeodes luniger TaxID=3066300 RepID=UPI0030D41EBB